MVDVRPFRGLRFNPARVEHLGGVVAPPYDVISADEKRALLDRSPYNVVRVELPSAESGDPYEQAARTLEAWRSQGVLIGDESPCLYLYEARFPLGGEERARRSVVAGLRLEAWEAGQVLPHERTMAAPKENRLRLLRSTRANVSPVWTLFSGASAALSRAWDWAEAHPAEASFRLEDGTTHRLWKLDDGDLI